MRSARRKIPSFSLYGEEALAAQLPASTHIEDIPSRSRKYLWQIDAHRHRELSQCVVVTAGPVTVTLEATQRSLRGPAAILVPAGTVHSFRFSADTAGFVLTVDLSQLARHVGASQQAAVEALFALPRAVALGADPMPGARIAALLECLLREYRRPERLPEDIAAALACAVLASVAEGCGAAPGEPHPSGTGLAQLRAFRALIEANYSQHWLVARYARKLQSSETALNRLCLRLTGHTAFNLIQCRLALEAQRRLLYGGATVGGIASDLGFKDLAYFSRFFRRHNGLSPHQFRKRHGGGKVPMPIRIVP